MDREEAIDILTQLKDFNEYNINRKGQHLIYIPKAEKMLINYAIDYILSEVEESKKTIAEIEYKSLKKKYILKQKILTELEKAKKENEAYEQHNKESRMYWINKGKISLAKKISEDII